MKRFLRVAKWFDWLADRLTRFSHMLSPPVSRPNSSKLNSPTLHDGVHRELNMRTKLNTLSSIEVAHDASRWTLLRERSKYLSDWGLQVLCTGLANYTGTILIEPYYVCKDHRNLFSNFYSKKLRAGDPNCHRLHFFARRGITPQSFISEPTSFADEYIGNSVIRPVAERSLGRTIIDPDKVGRRYKDGFFCLRTPFPVHINGNRLKVFGYPYISQDTDATVCAHATLWGVCRYFSQRHASYAEILPYDLVKLTATSTGRVVPYRGMTYADYSKILSDFGCHPLVILMKEKDDSSAISNKSFNDVYSYVESGIPVLASFGGHVGSLIGHTLDFTRSFKPDNQGVVASSAFLKQFILIDDNYFPYQLLGFRGDKENYSPSYSIDTIVSAVCPLPEKVYLPAGSASKQARVILRSLLSIYSRAAFGPSNGEPLITRLFFTTGSSLKKRKLQMAEPEKNGVAFDRISAFVSDIRLPHFVWIMEIGSLSLYREGRAAAEIALDATANELEESAIYARVGSYLIVDDLRKDFAGNPTTFPQYTHNLGER